MDHAQFYINGSWVNAADTAPHEVFDHSTELPFTKISWGTKSEVDQAVAAARKAFLGWGMRSQQDRLALLKRLLEVYEARMPEMAAAISQEMGAPIDMALDEQAAAGQHDIRGIISALENMSFEHPLGPNTPTSRIHMEPIGVAALITPWNWPMNQVCLKVAGALAAGCTMVLKPSEIAPTSSMLFAEFVYQAGIPAGVFNLINGDGAGVGSQLSAHPGIDMVSFTGSTRAGIAISKAAADNVKRVSLELGGKSPNLIFADADVQAAARDGAIMCYDNTGQSCDAPTRMLVECGVYDQVVAIAAKTAAAVKVDLAAKSGDHLGPLVSQAQFDKVQGLIQTGINEGARLVAGGMGRAEGHDSGWFARPTVFADVTPDMTLWREEVFGPVLTITAFDSEEQAIEMANDTVYGLSSYLQTGDAVRARRVSRALRAGMVNINGDYCAEGAPFGGYKQSGNGREGGRWGIEGFLEVKSISGWPGTENA